MQPQTQKRFYTVEELADEWIVSRETIRRMIRAGELDSLPIGRYHRIPGASVQSYINTNLGRR